MSDFAAEIKRIVEVRDHPNADRLALYSVENLSYQLVAPKTFTFGQRVVFIPIDAVLPDWLIDKIGLTGKLSGPKKNRVKTVRLRGEISQGLIVPVEDVAEVIGSDVPLNLDVTQLLGIEKYEPEIHYCIGGRNKTLPPGVESYDIQGCQKYHRQLSDLINSKVDVVITEKLEGTNFACVAYRDGSIHVCSHNHSIEEDAASGKQNVYWAVARSGEFLERAAGLVGKLGAESVAIRCEIIGPGIQGNIYKLKAPQARIFDIQVNGQYQDYPAFLTLVRRSNRFVKTRVNEKDLLVPALFYGKLKDWLGTQSIENASDGFSLLNPEARREGIVIKPMKERWDSKLGRVILKQRSPEYLVNEE